MNCDRNNDPGIIAVVCMVSCCCTPIAIITGIAAVICFAVTPKVRGTRGNKAKAGLICGIIGIIGSVILITVFVVNILLSSDFQNEMKEFNTHYDIHIDEKMMTLYKIIRSMPCFFKKVTHFYCPACGGTRSVTALLHLDIERAFYVIQLLYIQGLCFSWCIAGWMVKKLTVREMKSMKPRLWMLILGVWYFLLICGDQKYTGVPVWI